MDLYLFREKYPDASLEPFLKKSSSFFQMYIQRGLQNIENEKKKASSTPNYMMKGGGESESYQLCVELSALACLMRGQLKYICWHILAKCRASVGSIVLLLRVFSYLDKFQFLCYYMAIFSIFKNIPFMII